MYPMLLAYHARTIRAIADIIEHILGPNPASEQNLRSSECTRGKNHTTSFCNIYRPTMAADALGLELYADDMTVLADQSCYHHVCP